MSKGSTFMIFHSFSMVSTSLFFITGWLRGTAAFAASLLGDLLGALQFQNFYLGFDSTLTFVLFRL